MSTARESVAAEQGSSVYVYLAAIVAATAGLLFGFDIAVINGALIFLQNEFHLTDVETEIATSSLLFGCIFGSMLAGSLTDRLGRRRVLMITGLGFAASAIGAAMPRTLGQFIAARFIGGLAIGAGSVLAPLYIAEVSPAQKRGRLVSLNQMAIVSGILIAYLVNWSLSFLGPESWRWMFVAAAVPSMALFVALFFVPESPRWLVEQGHSSDALAVLTRVNGPVIAAQELKSIEETVAEESGTLRELFMPAFRRPLWIAVSLAILQQITGMNTVLFYGALIFKKQVGHETENAAIFANVIVGLVNALATVVALWLIDRLGRRPLLMVSTSVMAFSQAGLGLAFLSGNPSAALVLTMMLFCVAAFAIGLGPGFWVLLSEVFPTRIRGRAMSIATVCLWCASTLLTVTFLTLTKAVSPTGAFLIYAGFCVVTFAIVWLAVPETKGRTLEEIEQSWLRQEST
ncbi:MAG: sugar porter family MFS transporter [Acidobacteriaceae bacterium]|nr:sugar porter family MFS transporter [Acidobacteriaceae bacterium]